MWHVTGFYRFQSVADPGSVVASMRPFAERLGVKGTLLVATEGVNGTVAAESRPSVEDFLSELCRVAGIESLTRNDSATESPPFLRLKVKLKKEIIAFRRPEAAPAQGVGSHVDAMRWNQLISRSDVVVLDTRNRYEVDAGTFRGAVDPQIDAFGEFADFTEAQLQQLKDRPVAMFCTGGIRCEKASAYLLAKGVREVYQLEGGILRYLNVVPPEESLFEGTCYVFDQRETVGP